MSERFGITSPAAVIMITIMSNRLRMGLMVAVAGVLLAAAAWWALPRLAAALPGRVRHYVPETLADIGVTPLPAALPAPTGTPALALALALPTAASSPDAAEPATPHASTQAAVGGQQSAVASSLDAAEPTTPHASTQVADGGRPSAVASPFGRIGDSLRQAGRSRSTSRIMIREEVRCIFSIIGLSSASLSFAVAIL